MLEDSGPIALNLLAEANAGMTPDCFDELEQSLAALSERITAEILAPDRQDIEGDHDCFGTFARRPQTVEIAVPVRMEDHRLPHPAGRPGLVGRR
jgi:hypothetical protein